MIAWMLETLLEDMGFSSIAITATGEEAIGIADRICPGLIVSDINLGSHGMDGIDAASAIRAHTGVPVIFVSGHAGSVELARIAHDVPGALVLRKPIDATALQRSVVQMLKKGPRCH